VFEQGPPASGVITQEQVAACVIFTKVIKYHSSLTPPAQSSAGVFGHTSPPVIPFSSPIISE